IGNGRALESSAEDHDDGQANAGETERPVEDTPSGICTLPGEKTAVEEKDRELDANHGGGPRKLECELNLRAQKAELAGDHRIIRTLTWAHSDEPLDSGDTNSHRVLPMS
ncbi:MAG: hypothetical protein Q9184_008574, partial [Pyrenodesmia sp. 2 TL-2023]